MIEQRFEFMGDGLYVYTSVPQYGGGVCESNLVMAKEIFQECYKKWIKPQESEPSDEVKKFHELQRELSFIDKK